MSSLARAGGRAAQERDQLARTKGSKKVILFSQLLDAGLRRKVETKKRSLKRRRAAVTEQVFSAEGPVSSASQVASSAKVPEAITVDTVALSTVKERLAPYVGQVLPGLVAAAISRNQEFVDEDYEDLLSQIRTPLNRAEWKQKIRLEVENREPATPAVSQLPVQFQEDEIEWEEEENGEDKSLVPEPKKVRITADWSVADDTEQSATAAHETNKTDIIKAVERQGELLTLDRIDLTAGLRNITESDEVRNSVIKTPPKYDPRDPAFALDALNRRRLQIERRAQEEKALKEKAAEEAKIKAATSASGTNSAAVTTTTTTGGSSSVLKSEKTPGRKKKVPQDGKTIPGRGPDKKFLLYRRITEFGPLLRQFGIWSADGMAIPITTAAAPLLTNPLESNQEPPVTSNWKTLLPNIRHSEPAQELEGFEPQFRYANTLKSFHRPPTHHKEMQRMRLVPDPTQFDQARGGGGGAGGVRVDVVGASGTADAALNEIELSVSSRAWKKKDLSSKNGKIALLEYAEQYPLFLNGYGMNSTVINVYRKDTATNYVPPKLDFGMSLELNDGEFSPFMTKVLPGKSYRVLRNNMMNVPLFEHRPSSNDFLLVKPKARSTVTTPLAADGSPIPEVCLVRRINRVFTCGQVEPQMEVFTPSEAYQSRTRFLDWLERYMEFHFATRLKRRDDMRIQLQTAAEMFSLGASERMVEIALSKVAERDTHDTQKRTWVPHGAQQNKPRSELRKDLEEKRRACLTKLRPEDCCSWEQLQLGLFRLFSVGIEKVSRSEIAKVMEAYKYLRRLHDRNGLRQQSHEALMELRLANKVPFHMDENTRKMLASTKYVVRELQLTPWYLSHCYYWLQFRAERPRNPFPQGTVMRISGLGAPLDRMEMVSYLPKLQDKAKSALALEAAGDDDIIIETSDGKTTRRRRAAAGTGPEKQKLGGTENDLRILGMPALGEILIDLGLSPELVATIERWDRTWLIEKFASSEKGAYLLGGSIAKYARVPGSNNPSLDMAGDGGANDMSPADEYKLRKKLEESDTFRAHRERVTEVYERMAKVLSLTALPPSAASVGGATAQPASTNTTTSAIGDDTAAASNGDQDFLDMIVESMAATTSSTTTTSKDDVLDAKEESAKLEKMLRDNQASKQKEEEAARNLAMQQQFAQHQQQMQHAGWQPFKVLKRTIIEVRGDGSEHVRVEYHKSTDAVAKFEAREAARLEAEAQGLVVANSADNVFSRQRHHQSQLRIHASSIAAAAAAGQLVMKRGGPGRKPGPKKLAALAASAASGMSSSGSAVTGTNNGDGKKRVGRPPANAVKVDKQAEKARQTRELQQKHAQWYQTQVQRFGPHFAEEFTESDARMPSTMPRKSARGARPAGVAPPVLRCGICMLPGHSATDPLCPLYDPHSQDPSTTATKEANRQTLIAKKVAEQHLTVPPGPLADLSLHFVRVVDMLLEQAIAAPFSLPVDRTVPNYYKIVKHPTDLCKIRGLALTGRYTRKDAFLEALRLMRDNAGLYNGRESLFFVNANQLLEMAGRDLAHIGQEISSLESRIPLQRVSAPSYNQAASTSALTPFDEVVIPEEEEEEIIIEEDEGAPEVSVTPMIPEDVTEEIVIEEIPEEEIIEEEEEEIEESEEPAEEDQDEAGDKKELEPSEQEATDAQEGGEYML